MRTFDSMEMRSGIRFTLGLFVRIALVFSWICSLSAQSTSPFSDSIQQLIEMGSPRMKSRWLMELSDYWLEQKDTLQAASIAREALTFAYQYESIPDLVRSLTRLGEIAMWQDSLEPAMAYLNLAMSKAQSLDKESNPIVFNDIYGKALKTHAICFFQLNPDSVKKVVQDLHQVIALLEQTGEIRTLAEARYELGKIYFLWHLKEKGLEQMKKSLLLYQNLNDFRMQALIYTTMASHVERETSLQYTQEALRLFALARDSTSAMARMLTSIAFKTRDIIGFDKAREYEHAAYEIYQKRGDTAGMAYCLFHLGTFCIWESNDMEAATSFYLRGTEMSEKISNTWMLGLLYVSLAMNYKNLGLADSATYYFQLGDSVTDLIPDSDQRIRFLYQSGQFEAQQGKFRSAEEKYQEALSLAQHRGTSTMINTIYWMIHELYKLQGDFERSQKFYKKHIHYRDSLYSLEKERRVIEMQIRYETDKMADQLEIMRQNEVIKNAEIRRKQTIIYFIIAGLMLIVVFTILVIRQYLKKQKAYQSLMEKNLALMNEGRPPEPTMTSGNAENQDMDPHLTEELLKKLDLTVRDKKIYLRNDLTLKSLAKKCGTNSSYLSRLINQHFGTNFSNYINEFRIREAQKLMALPQYKAFSIEGISTEVGFSSKSVFNVAFKKFTGVTPSYYQRYLAKKLDESGID